MNMSLEELKKLAKLIRYWVLKMTTEAGSGHATSSLSAVELMAGLMFGNVFRFTFHDPRFINNDRLIFSKGHASPLFYALWFAAQDAPLHTSSSPEARVSTSASSVQASQEEINTPTSTLYTPLSKAEDPSYRGDSRGPLDRGHEIPTELMTLRKFGSQLEGHPTMRFPYSEAATGSLGQGLSVGVGMALNAKVEGLSYRTFVLLGDSEMAEGSNWEAIQLAAHYKLDNLVGILDVNRLGQRGQTMYGHDVVAYKKRLKAFGWQTFTVNGHDLEEILGVYKQAMRVEGKPTMIIDRTIKGKGVSWLEDKNGWHGRALSKEELERALRELGEVDMNVRGVIAKPEEMKISNSKFLISNEIPNAKIQKEIIDNSANALELRKNSPNPLLKREGFIPPLQTKGGQGEFDGVQYEVGQMVATREAYGEALVKLGGENPEVVVLDGEVSNSTFAEKFKAAFPKRFFEMFIAEQNMVGTAVGLARRGKIPWVSTFAAFFTRAFDQIRMAAYSEANIKFCGSHAGVSIGEDGASQMGLEDIALFRSVKDSVVLYPSDAVSTEKLVREAARHNGIVYLRTTRNKTPVIYEDSDGRFRAGGCVVLRFSEEDAVTVVAAGITVHEALKAYDELLKEGIKIRVIDLYSIKPLNVEILRKAAAETKAIITVEDHYPEGGIGEAVAGALCHPELVSGPAGLIEPDGISRGIVNSPARNGKIISLAVRKMPMSGKPEELLRYEEIDAEAIIKQVKAVL